MLMHLIIYHRLKRLFFSSGETVRHGEDRVCSTAMAINALLFSWTTGDKLDPEVPAHVKEVVANASLWLMKNVKKRKAYNVVFSGSVKANEVC